MMTLERAISLAQKYARADTEHAYTKVSDFMPHEWVVAAIQTAYEAGRQAIIDGSNVAGFTPEAIERTRDHLSQPQPVAQGRVSGDCDGDPVWSFAYGKSIYSIVQHPEGHQLVHTNGGELKLISKPFNLVAQGEAVDEAIEAVIACLGDDAATLRDRNPEDEMAANMDEAARLLSATPTIPTGHRVVPDALPDDAVIFGDDDDDGYRMGWNACRNAMLAASPSAGGV